MFHRGEDHKLWLEDAFLREAKELAVSEELAEKYQRYRVFKFRESPKAWMLGGSLRQSCALDPIQHEDSLR